ncbi:MAG: hypothetical protein M1832_004875 [Thelocarpon impressellum]|nr:MAG: hypothetical protein M1832_004875 [Thelocarpon impressellum]
MDEKDAEKAAEKAASDQQMAGKLRDAEVMKVEHGAPSRAEQDVLGDAAAGKATKPADGVLDGKDDTKKEKGKEDETQEEHDVEVELNSILKRSPIIIFSKTYCPHSRRAKSILLEKYKIVPPPYVEELDVHPLGAALQDALLKTTGRRTVPNVLVNGRSIGGGDDVAKLDRDGELSEKIKKMGGKRIMEAGKADGT